MSQLLFLCHRIPYPPDKGDKIRAWHMLSHLARRFAVHLGCLADDPADLVHVERLRRICASVACVRLDPRRQQLASLLRLRPGRSLSEGYFHHPKLAGWVDDVVAREAIDRAFVFSAAMAPYLDRHPGLRRILDMVDVDSAKWGEYGERARGPARLFWAREAATMLTLERRAAAAADRTLFVSAAECRRFAKLAPEAAAGIDWVENGVDLDYFDPARRFPSPFDGAEPAIVFTGRMDYRPNVDAAAWFAQSVLPLLRRALPALRFVVVGAAPDRRVRRLGEGPGVVVTGRVPDIRPYLAHSACVVAPLRIARGIQNKVLEAMAMGRPVVATEAAFEGLRAVPGQELLLAADAAAMATAVRDVLAGRHPSLGAAARRRVAQDYAWETTLARLDALLPPAAAWTGAAEAAA